MLFMRSTMGRWVIGFTVVEVGAHGGCVRGARALARLWALAARVDACGVLLGFCMYAWGLLTLFHG
jgi:hypothetical protein